MFLTSGPHGAPLASFSLVRHLAHPRALFGSRGLPVTSMESMAVYGPGEGQESSPPGPCLCTCRTSRLSTSQPDGERERNGAPNKHLLRCSCAHEQENSIIAWPLAPSRKQQSAEAEGSSFCFQSCLRILVPQWNDPGQQPAEPESLMTCSECTPVLHPSVA